MEDNASIGASLSSHSSLTGISANKKIYGGGYFNL